MVSEWHDGGACAERGLPRRVQRPSTPGVSSAALQGATNILGAGFNLSANAANLPHFQRALNSGRAPRVLWLGDSICDNTFESVVRLFESYWPGGVQRGAQRDVVEEALEEKA